ncbi:MAG: hypothetical protein IT244_13875 [Bacteroidia bacterium]|nr:hypothetical protein [Bacteroidia bacterium]
MTDYNTAKTTLDSIIRNACDEKEIDFSSIQLNEELNLIESGIFDSLGLLQLIAELEEQLGIEIDLSEEDPEDFTQYSKLLDIIAKQ